LVSSGSKSLASKDLLDFLFLRADELPHAHSICRGSAGRAKKSFSSKFSGNQLRDGGGTTAAPPPPRAPSFGVSVPAVGGQGGAQERRVWIENLIVGRIVQTSICLGGS
jgi:hypothetical protein